MTEHTPSDQLAHLPLLSALAGPGDLRAMDIAGLEQLALEIRRAIIDQVMATGGHLAPNLGVVELTLAMHRVFDFAHDRLLFDVGHQCYPHKLITGRLPLLANLRTSRGMAGFPEPSESPYDLFRVGHAGTAISTAVGLARGDSLRGEEYHPKARPDGRRVVAVVGDASIANGVAMEGLNAAGTLNRQMLVILNDNGMSIGRPQGALAAYFDRVRVSHRYLGMKRAGSRLLSRVPAGGSVRGAYHVASEVAKKLVGDDSVFSDFGLLTVGPIDGHDLPTLIEFLSEVRDIDRPVLLHVKTIKGKGLDVAEGDATKFHSPKAFKLSRDAVTGCRIEMAAGGRSFTSAFGDALGRLMAEDSKVVACTAAMADGTGLTGLMQSFPDRVWDVGICESHAMDMMAGLARTGFRPFFAVYSTFLQRAFDQAFQEVALQGLPVRLCLDRAGLVGGDGAVHHGFCDIALLRTLPTACLMAAMDEPSLEASLRFMQGYEEGLSAVRYPRDSVAERADLRALGECPAFELGRARCLTPNIEQDSQRPDAAVLAYGTMALNALDARSLLGDEFRISVYDARFAKPVDTRLLARLADAGIPIVTVEDHTSIGGFGSAVLEALNDAGIAGSTVVRLGIPDHWIMQDSRSTQLAAAGIDAAGIAAGIRRAVAMKADQAPRRSHLWPASPATEPARA